MSPLDPMDVPEPPRRPALGASLQRQPFVALLSAVLIGFGVTFTYGIYAGHPLGDLALGTLILPGIACAMIWLRAVVRFRLIVTMGLAARTTVDENGRYEFLDRQGRAHAGRTDPRHRGPAVVLYDESRPSRQHVLGPGDYDA